MEKGVNALDIAVVAASQGGLDALKTIVAELRAAGSPNEHDLPGVRRRDLAHR
ncbi:hypothetical protein [Paraburkholderia sp. DGU8]|uniref:hypothetical protein n=1 Tax=Paraburkholderia sp. DGU8 TaxID=3161997 RepID=UPI003467BC9E